MKDNVAINSSKVKQKTFKDTEQFFNSNLERNVFDSLHSYSKYSSLGGTHTIEKKRRKLKNNPSFKKKRTKPNSSKKSDKGRSSGPFNDPIVMKNYRSANLTSNPVKIMNAKQIDNPKKRYQYHKRIRSDTGHTIMNPLDQMYERSQKYKNNNLGQPLYSKAGTDISTPMVAPSDEHRYSALENRIPVGIVNNSNTIQVNKYEFAPSFTHHKNVTLDSNSQVRRFKTNKSIPVGFVKNKNQPSKVPENKGLSYTQSPSKSHTRKPSKAGSIKNDHPYDYSPKQPDSFDTENNFNGEVIKESNNEYCYDSDNLINDMKQNKLEVKKTLQLLGDRSISMSKETDEVRKSEAKPLSITPDHESSKFGTKKSSELIKINTDDNYESFDEIQTYLRNESLQIHHKEDHKATTKIVQID